MFPSIGSDHNVVNGTESGRYLAGPLAITGAVMAMSCCGGGAMQPPKDVREFVSQHWVEGVPYQVASQYTEDDAKRLLEWLVKEPEKHEEFLPEIVTTLCFIGSEVAVKPLIDFVGSPRASRAIFNAKNAALIHLGDLINKSENQAALDFLTRVATNMEAARALAEPQVSVAADEAAVVGVVAPTVEALGSELAVSATFGLSLAGTPDADKIISSLRDNPNAFASVNQAATEAAEISRSVRARGQEEYYKMKSEGQN